MFKWYFFVQSLTEAQTIKADSQQFDFESKKYHLAMIMTKTHQNLLFCMSTAFSNVWEIGTFEHEFW